MSGGGLGRYAATLTLTSLAACGLVSGLDDLERVDDDGGSPVADASRDVTGDDARSPADAELLDAGDGARTRDRRTAARPVAAPPWR